MTDPPLTVVEILSPNQGMEELISKADAYFEAGVKSCWIVQPLLEAIAPLVRRGHGSGDRHHRQGRRDFR
jgi:Uma2 family endonuclease